MSNSILNLVRRSRVGGQLGRQRVEFVFGSEPRSRSLPLRRSVVMVTACDEAEASLLPRALATR